MFLKEIIINWDRISEQSYLRRIGAFTDLHRLKLEAPVTFFVGENGSGKSTLLEAVAIADGFNPEGGTRNYHFSTYDSHGSLWEAVTLSKTKAAGWGYFFRAESFYNVATKEAEYSRGPGGHPQYFHEKSHGESFIQLMSNSLNKNGLFFMDEPEAALSPQRQLSLLREIERYSKQGSQFIIATHSPILLGLPDAKILCFDDSGIHESFYEETESYQITELFINHREQILRNLLDK